MSSALGWGSGENPHTPLQFEVQRLMSNSGVLPIYLHAKRRRSIKLGMNLSINRVCLDTGAVSKRFMSTACGL